MSEFLHFSLVGIPAVAGGVVEVLLEWLQIVSVPVDRPQSTSWLFPFQTASSSVSSTTTSVTSSVSKPSTTTSTS